MAVAGEGSADDAGADFSPRANPQGPWRYGWTARAGGELAPPQLRQQANGIDLYTGGGQSFVGHNATRRAQTLGTGHWPPGMLGLHPGRDGERAVVRWTAPRSGLVEVDALYTRRDPVYPTTTDVHVWRRGREIFAAEIDAERGQARFRSLVSVRQGDALDFGVGWGRNGNWFGDTTGLELRVRWAERAASEPSVTSR